MRCLQCGMPLSPSRTQCPRCGATANEKAKPRQEVSAGGFFPAAGQAPQAGYESSPQWASPEAPNMAPMPQTPISSGQLPATPTPGMSASNWQAQAPYAITRTPQSQMHSKVKIGFTAAGLCVTAGALLLIFVFIMAQSLPPEGTTVLQQPTSTSTNQTQQKPTATSDATKPAATPTATPSAVAKEYVASIQMASAVSATAEPTTLTTQFTAGQPIYVTMVIYQKAYSGHICLAWYSNQQPFWNESYKAQPGHNYPQSNAYFYTRPDASLKGPGYVEVSWADNSNCTNKVLIQRAEFTIV